jgi:Ion channel
MAMAETLPQSERRRPFLVRVFTGHRFLILFIFLLVSVVAYPYMEEGVSGYYTIRLLGAGIIALSVYVVSFRRSLTVVAVLLAIPAAVQRLVHPSPSAGFLPVLNLVLSFTFDVWIVVAIFRRVFADVRISSETVFGALCVYLLNGLTFASIYGLAAALQPHAFLLDPTTNGHTALDRFDCIYYSFGMMTQLGAAGITAISDQARSISLLEAIVGQLYLAVLIARVVSAYRRHPPAGEA